MAAAASATGGFSFDGYVYLAARRRRINETLQKALDDLDADRQHQHPLAATKKIHDSIRHSLLADGKRLRPILAIAACELVGGDEATAMPFACAAEMIHTMSLIHDDLPCVDDDDLRRGRPSNHAVFGESVAVLAADALLSMAFRHAAAARTAAPPDLVLRALAELSRAAGAEGIAGGQVADVLSEGKDVDLDLLEHIQEHKTGKLLQASAACGAIVGGGGEQEVEGVRRYAKLLGILSQIADDVIDATKTSGEMGKTAGKDLASDKATIVKLMGLERAKEFAGELMGRAEAELARFDPARAAPLVHFNREIKKFIFGFIFS